MGTPNQSKQPQKIAPPKGTQKCWSQVVKRVAKEPQKPPKATLNASQMAPKCDPELALVPGSYLPPPGIVLQTPQMSFQGAFLIIF